MERFHARCARDGIECTVCQRVFAPPVLGPFIFDERPFLSTGASSRGVVRWSFGDLLFDFGLRFLLHALW